MEELKGFEENIKMFEENLTDEELEKFNTFKEELSKMEQLTDDELENIAGGVSEKNEPALSVPYDTFLIYAGAAAMFIHRGNKSMAIRTMMAIRGYRSNPIYQYLREAFREKFKVDPSRYHL